MSISSAARAMARKAASPMTSGAPTSVTTVRLVSLPGSTSSTATPSTPRAASTMASIFLASRPSEKLGTHSTSRWVMAAYSIVRLVPGPSAFGGQVVDLRRGRRGDGLALALRGAAQRREALGEVGRGMPARRRLELLQPPCGDAGLAAPGVRVGQPQVGGPELRVEVHGLGHLGQRPLDVAGLGVDLRQRKAGPRVARQGQRVAPERLARGLVVAERHLEVREADVGLAVVGLDGEEPGVALARLAQQRLGLR